MKFFNSLNLPFLSWTDLISTAILTVLMILIRWILANVIYRRNELSADYRRQLLTTLRNVLVLIYVFGLAFIWGHELRTLAFSLVAFAAALVVAAKELLMCLSGSFMRLRSKLYVNGDYIEINNLRGIVLKYNLLTTTVLEYGSGSAPHQYTGRLISFPNSILITYPLINESLLERFGISNLSIHIAAGADLALHEQALLQAARAETAEFADEIRRQVADIEKKEIVTLPPIDPEVFISSENEKIFTMQVRFAAPIKRRVLIEQRILRLYLNSMYSNNFS
jgi:small-conductance mechanosensitive channel